MAWVNPKIRPVGRGDKHLGRKRLNQVHQMPVSTRIKLTRYIVEQEERTAPTPSFSEDHLSQTKGQGGRSNLSLTTITTQRLFPDV